MTEAPGSAENILLSPAEKRSERTRPICDEGRTGLANTVGKREAKVGLKELFNVRPPDILRLFNFHNAKNLQSSMITTETGQSPPKINKEVRT
jgi:hypothetical protein